jgi:hypothetical protein
MDNPDLDAVPETPPPTANADDIITFLRASYRRNKKEWQRRVHTEVLPMADFVPKLKRDKADDIDKAGGWKDWCNEGWPPGSGRPLGASYDTVNKSFNTSKKYRHLGTEPMDWLNNPKRNEYPNWQPQSEEPWKAYEETCIRFVTRHDNPDPLAPKPPKERKKPDQTNTVNVADPVETPGLAIMAVQRDRAIDHAERTGRAKLTVLQQRDAAVAYVQQLKATLKAHNLAIPKPDELRKWLNSVNEDDDQPARTDLPKAGKAVRKTGRKQAATGEATPRKANRKGRKKAAPAAPEPSLLDQIKGAWTGDTFDVEKLRQVFAGKSYDQVTNLIDILQDWEPNDFPLRIDPRDDGELFLWHNDADVFSWWKNEVYQFPNVGIEPPEVTEEITTLDQLGVAVMKADDYWAQAGFTIENVKNALEAIWAKLAYEMNEPFFEQIAYLHANSFGDAPQVKPEWGFRVLFSDGDAYVFAHKDGIDAAPYPDDELT